MPRYSLTPDRLFDRPWRPGHPFRPKTGRARQVGMLALFGLLAAVIAAYNVLTDAGRVRGMAESYLSELIGARVTVGKANLSLFQGMRLDNVKVFVDDPADGTTRPASAAANAKPTAEDAEVFSASSIVVQSDFRSLVRGRLEATRIIAEKPVVRLTRDVRTGAWNVDRLGRDRANRPTPPAGEPPGPPVKVPELLVRSAKVEFSEMRGGRLTGLGFVALDGQLTPRPGGSYDFVLQSRGASDALGALVRGSVNPASGDLSARLEQFEFGQDVQSLLFQDLRDWWRRHNLAGRLDVPTLEYSPPRDGRPARFTVKAVLGDVALAIPPEEWMSADEARRHADARAAAEMLRDAYGVGGFRVQRSEGRFGVQGSRFGKENDSAGAVANAGPGPTTLVPVAAPVRPALSALNPEPSSSLSLRAEGRSLNPSGRPRTPNPPPAPPPLTPAGQALDLLSPQPIQMEHVAGTFVFTQDGIDVEGVTGRLEDNGFKVTGRIGGYRPDAPVALCVTTLDGEFLTLPDAPRYVWSMPPDVQEMYQTIRPQGALRLRMDVLRAAGGAAIECDGVVDVHQGRFQFRDFPYPLRGVTGQVRFGRDPRNGLTWISLHDVRGSGPAGGPNQDGVVAVNGWIGPIGPGLPLPGLCFRVRSDDVASEPPLMAAFDPDVRTALALFDAPGKGELPQFRGSVVCDITRPIGAATPEPTCGVDVRLTDASGTLVAFPYPLRGVTGELRIRDGFVDLVGVRMKRGDATLALDGRVGFTGADDGAAGPARPKYQTDLKLTVNGLPVDEPLLAALPVDVREWVRKVGAAGRADVEGRLYEPLTARPAPARTVAGPGAAAVASRPAARGVANQAAPPSGNVPTPHPRPAAPQTSTPAAEPAPLAYDLAITLRDGTIRPAGSPFAVTDVAAAFRLRPGRLDVASVRGRRGAGDLAARGRLTWPADGRPAAGAGPTLALIASARNLRLDPALYALLPADARDVWDEVRPEGTLDADVTYAGDVGTDDPPRPRRPGGDVLTVDLTRPQPAVTVDGLNLPPGLHATLRPRELSAMAKSVPYRLDHLGGSVAVAPGMVLLKDVTGRHGDARLALAGTGTTAGRSVWDLRVVGEDVPVDDDLRRALPPAVAKLFESLKLKGTIGFSLSKLVYRAPDPAAGPATRPAATTAAGGTPEPELDVVGTFRLSDASLDAGVPLEQVQGSVAADATIRNGRLSTLTGGIDFASLTLAGRPMQSFKTTLAKPADRNELHLTQMRGRLAGGDVGGQVVVSYPDAGPSRYALALAVRNADVRDLAAESDHSLNGRLTASLALEGAWDRPGDRRGRGDVVVAGKDMYRIPVLLGLTQVTNLALPISAPFENAVARYSVDGQRVTFERVELRSNNMLMSGDGSLDFGTKQVRMTFVTDNPGGFRVPFLQDLWRGAQHELLRIHVKGTVQEPKVRAGMFGTVTTTVDEVFRGDPPRRDRGDKGDKGGRGK